MGIFEIVSAIILIIACVFIVIVVLMKDTKTQMSQTISGTSSDSFYQKNAGRTKEAILNKATVVAAVIFFVLALAVNIINVYWGGKEADADDTSSIVSDILESMENAESADSSDAESADSSDSESENSSDSDSENSSDSESENSSDSESSEDLSSSENIDDER